MTLVSVIIPTKNRPIAVADAVRSVFSGTYQKFELFVVDQSLDDATHQALIEFIADSRFYYKLNRRPGFGAASSRNIGIALSNGEIVAIIDDDVTVKPDWMANLVAEFEADSNLQFICGKLTAPNYDWREGYVPNFDPEPNLSKWQMPVKAAGANFSMRRRLFDKIGGYDEFCGPGSRLGASDDGDISFRIMRSGAKWKAASNVEVVHTHGFRSDQEAIKLLKRYQRGIGGNFGRFTRRGDVVAGLWFLGWQFVTIFKMLFLALRDRRRPSGLGWLIDRFIGFGKGFILPSKEGFVSGARLVKLRQELLSASSTVDAVSAPKHS